MLDDFIFCYFRVLLRSRDALILQPGQSRHVQTDLTVWRKSAYHTPKLSAQILPLTNHWLSGFANKVISVKPGYIDPCFYGNLSVTVYNKSPNTPLEVLAFSPLAEIELNPFHYV